MQMALCLRAMERYDEAAAAFRQALELATFSSEEITHILYLLGQTLESLGQYAQALEAYGWARKEDPGFLDVAHRIKHLLSGDAARSRRINKTTSLGSKTCADEGNNSRLRFCLCWTRSGNRRRLRIGWGPIRGGRRESPSF